MWVRREGLTVEETGGVEVTITPTASLINAGEWVGIHGSVLYGGEKIKTAEVWLIVNERYVKCMPQTTWHSRYWFHARFGSGVYRVRVEGYKVMREVDTKEGGRVYRIKKEYKVSSPTIAVISRPRIIGSRLLPMSYEVQNWRKVAFEEAKTLAEKAIDPILAEHPDTSRIFLVGGVIDRGWTRRDIDLLVYSKGLYSAVEGKTTKVPEGSWKAPLLEEKCEDKVGYPVSIFADIDPKNMWKGKLTLQIYPEA